ncbi:protein of unknown function DUF883 ElaB [Cellvibrio sp. BR]|jgi:ElaB/YqjD/DUF883 family membrane-anchored ribosome-binding protein|uniref:DUF883 family protein n=1 Tax=unclassified Cellvibrio TaxID=2624793 RepID=UPI0002600E3F|nr:MULTISPECIES: DUF883 family protein [unclassified Cellvibrio]EIK44552.1 protein of unknown function DUF883 ElaB [Cellvibrio sp. BR]QEY14051.1 DUF883 domain-containing protein [Cellvibrio sp. KY-YJ-3]UUA74662.1 DUF883 family protein [Cellvibrio sp. QJXJ]
MQNPSGIGSSSGNSKAVDTHAAPAQKAEGSSGIAHEFQSFVADIEDLIKATTNLTGEDLQRAKDKVNQRITAAKDAATEMGETVMNRARKTAETTNTYVHEQPWNAIGASAAVGLLLGYLLARRN